MWFSECGRCACVVNLKNGCAGGTKYAVRCGLWRSQKLCSNREIEGENCQRGDGSEKRRNCPIACAECNCASSPRTPGCVRCPSSGNRGSYARIFVKYDDMARDDDCFTATQGKKELPRSLSQVRAEPCEVQCFHCLHLPVAHVDCYLA